MTLTSETLRHAAKLACLEIDDTSPLLLKEMNALLDFARELQTVDTQTVEPLFHPLNGYQTLREDKITEPDSLQSLADMAPAFNGLYLVPKVLGAGKS